MDVLEDLELFLPARVTDDESHHETIELRLGQGIGPFVLQRVLSRHDHEGERELPGDPVGGHLALLHGLEQRRLLTHVHVADSFDHQGSSGLRYIVNPPWSPARVHQHLDIGQGEVDWDEFFGTLGRLGFDGIMTVCVFAWEERAEESCRYNLEQIHKYTQGW